MVNKRRGHGFWSKFVKQAINMLKDDGYLVFIHPPNWRNLDSNIYKTCFNLIKDRQLLYLEIHNCKDGSKTFNAGTAYDWYVLKNVKSTNYETIIKGQDNIINKINLTEWNFIPNMMFEEIKKLMNNDVGKNLDVNRGKLNVNKYRSNYGPDKKWISKEKSEEFRYPVIYSINKNNELSLKYSNTNKNGHFGIPKFIFSNGRGFFIDEKGEYGLTQWAYCIYDDIENLQNIKKAFLSDKFKRIRDAIQLDSLLYNYRVMKLFKRDFYKEFI